LANIEKGFMKKKLAFLILYFCWISPNLHAQQDLPTDYLSKEFHAGRREALRNSMPANSVLFIFSYPARTFSSDVDFPYHENPNLYYFSGYKEPNAVLILFKDPQEDSARKSYHELFFIQKRDSAQEIWTGRRMGVENVKHRLGFDHVFNGSEFRSYPIDFGKFDRILFAAIPTDLKDDADDDADLFDLYAVFKKKIALPESFNPKLSSLLGSMSRADMSNLGYIQEYARNMVSADASLGKDSLFTELLRIKDSAGIQAFRQKSASLRFNPGLYTDLIASLREIKTPEELVLLRKSIEISSIAHAEVMKAIRPEMSELEIQGLFEYVHKRYGAEYVGYPSIVGAGDNGCILHYEENSRTRVGNNMVLMDVGAEYHGYSADVTRTVPAGGKYSSVQRQIYDLVYRAQEEIMKICREGSQFSDLEKKSVEVLANGLMALGIIKTKEEVRRYYPHGCSHHLGLDVHDQSNYGPLKQNMVITVEPGIYIPENSPCDKKWWGVAVRIEDDVRIGKESCELLSAAAPRKSEDVEKTVAMRSALDQYILPPLPSAKKGF
jgi:Xaa-Pro aminopeptidase